MLQHSQIAFLCAVSSLETLGESWHDIAMKHRPAWRRRLRFWGADADADIADEFRFHLQTKIDELRAGGLDAEAPRLEALRQFGPLDAPRAECAAISRESNRRASRWEYFDGCIRDLRYAVRVLLNAKASTLTAVLILSVGIGATTAVFTLLDRLIYEPLPV